MSIDARVKAVRWNWDGSGSLELIDRPPNGCAGQSRLTFQEAPEEVTALNGLDIWGGSGSILLGETVIAKRLGYTRVEFVGVETLNRAISNYNKRTKDGEK